jgi:hypothetical protein
VTELDEYVFIVRMRIGKCYGFLQKGITADVDTDKVTSTPTVYIDIKLNSLRDVLRNVLKHIKWISLGGDKPSIYVFVHD